MKPLSKDHQPSSLRKTTIIINSKRKKKADPCPAIKRTISQDRFNDLLTICKSISEGTPEEDQLFCNEQLGEYMARTREGGTKSSRSYRLDLPQIREIEEENQEERKSFALTERRTHWNKNEELSTGLPTELPTNNSYKKKIKIMKNRPLCSSFSVAESLVNYGLPSSKKSPSKFQKISLGKTPKREEFVTIDVSKLLQTGREGSNSRYNRSRSRKTKSSQGYYSKS